MKNYLSSPTNREVVQGFKTLFADATGKPSGQNQWSVRLILFYLKMYRSRILYEKLQDPKQQIHRHNQQTIVCVELSEIDQTECPCAPPSGCTFQKSLYPVPRAIAGKYISVTSVTGSITYDYVRWDQFKHKLSSRFGFIKKSGYYTLKNFGEHTYLYVLQDNYKDHVAITAVFEDPKDVQLFPVCGISETPDECNPLDLQFNIDRELLPIVFQLTFEKLINIRNTARPDIINNDSDDTSTNIRNEK